MAKQRTSSGQHPVKSLTTKDKIAPDNPIWKSMTNWLIVLVMILPVLFSRMAVDPYIPIRYMWLAVFVLVFVIFFFVLLKMQIDFAFPPLIKAVFVTGICYGLWSLMSLFFAINVATAWYEVARHFLNIILLFLIMETVKQEGSQVLKLCKALLIVSLIQSSVGILQNYELAFVDIPGGAPPNGLMGNRNLFGSAQVLLLPFVIFVLYKAGNVWKYMSIAALTGIVVSVVVSQTRSAWLSSIVVMIISFILIFLFSLPNRKRWITGTLSATLCIVAVVCLILITNKKPNFPKSFREDTSSDFTPKDTLSKSAGDGAFTMAQPSLDDDKSSGRFSIWRQSLELLKDHWLIGVGPGNWKLAIPLYGSEGTRKADGLLVPSWPHNVYLQVACETGVPGALLYFSMWILLAIMGFKIISKSQSEDVRVLIILMISGLAAFAADSMFSFPTVRIEHSLYLVLMGGIILGHYPGFFETKNSIRPHEEGREIKLPPQQTTSSAINKSLLICILAVALFNLFLGYKKYNFEKYMSIVKAYRKQNLNQEALTEVKAGKTKFVTVDSNGEPLEIHSAAAYEKLKDYDKALEEIRIARSYHPNSARILTTMGVIYTDLKRYDSAISYYQQALRLTPAYAVALKNIAGVYFISGNYAACIETLDKMNIQNNQYLINLLNEAKRRREGQ